MGSVGRPAIMSLLLLLLPVALAGLPPHHQQLVERFGAENVNFDKNVRTAFCDSCMKSLLRAMEELRSINQTGLVVSQGTAPCGRTWFHSGPPTTLSTLPPTRCPTR